MSLKCFSSSRLHPKSQYISRYSVRIIPCDGKQYHIEEHIR
nr:hypothetical protein GZ27E7_7 [uncultured archaeon GZfos27E7]